MATEPDEPAVTDTEPVVTDTEPVGEPPEAARETEATTRPGSSRAVLIAGILAVAFLITSVVLLALLVSDRSGDETGEQVRVKTTATRLVQSLYSFDSTRGLDTQVVEELGTATLINQVKQSQAALLASFKTLGVTTSQATIKDVFLGQVGTDEAQVIVVLDFTVVGKTTTTQRDQYLDVSLLKLSGNWKVDVVQSLFNKLAPGSTATTATTAPGTPPTTASATTDTSTAN